MGLLVHLYLFSLDNRRQFFDGLPLALSLDALRFTEGCERLSYSIFNIFPVFVVSTDHINLADETIALPRLTGVLKGTSGETLCIIILFFIICPFVFRVSTDLFKILRCFVCHEIMKLDSIHWCDVCCYNCVTASSGV